MLLHQLHMWQLCEWRQGHVERSLAIKPATLGRFKPPHAAAEVDEHVELFERGRVCGLRRKDAAPGGCGARGGGRQTAGFFVLQLPTTTGRLIELGDQSGGHQLHSAALSVEGSGVGWDLGLPPSRCAAPGRPWSMRGGVGALALPRVFTSRKI